MASGTTSVWGRPYPLSTDAPNVHTDIQALANSLDKFPAYPSTATTATTAVAGLSYVVSAGVTLTLPASPTTGDIIRAIGASTVTGASPATVSASGGKAINGVGLSAASSYVLGLPFAHTTLQYDGTNWLIIDGERDSGWVSLTLGTNIGVGTGYTPAARLQGNRVTLCGAPVNNTGGAVSNYNIATLPAGMAPAVNLQIEAFSPSVGAVPCSVVINASTGVINFAPASGTWPNGGYASLDGVNYRRS